MQSVKVRRTGITAQQAAEVIRRGLGRGYQVEPEGETEILVRRGTFGRAKARIREEPGGTVFEVRGQGLPVPLLVLSLQFMNDRGIARRTADVLGNADEYRDNG